MTHSFPETEVKGIWFVTLRRYLEGELGPEKLADVIGAMPEEYRHAMESPLASSWYPEQTLAEALAAVDTRAAKGDDLENLRMIEACTEQGINRFFKVLLRMATPGFVIRQLPTLWTQMRRGGGKVRVEVSEKSATAYYTEFPHYDDRNYRLLLQGTLNTLMRVATKLPTTIDITEWGKDWLTVRISWGG